MKTCRLCGNSYISIIHRGTRDRQDIDVLRCNVCGLVFLSEITTDDSFYMNSQMRSEIDFMKWRQNTYADDNRRFLRYEALMQGKSILDFGCGNGGFLTLAIREEKIQKVVGVDLDAESVRYIKNSGIECYENTSNLPDMKFDIIFLFHVIEHLPNPEAVLNDLLKHIAEGGVIIIETPNAEDALLSVYRCQKFADFTYWSPHIYLYTETALTQMLKGAGFDVIEITQEQRYPLANHLRWLSEGLPGGGVDVFRELNESELNEAYAAVLAKQKRCDTITCTIRSV